ncbi:hypothetical protein Tco_1070926 [Tanacetum coccineum]|uniref:Retrovirus-related Pol polyprotein from transposon TNT 1-94 n=1 Tax=Tanacetum coccineum TaxID=301880 RepID=A0ABQ5HNW2_9ASTR
MSEPSYKYSVSNYSSVSKGFQPKFTLKLIQSSPNSSSQADPKFQKDYKAEYKKMKAKLALLEASPSSSQNPKDFQPKHKGLVAKTFDWDEEEVFDDEEVSQVKVLMALADDELTVGKSHARNGEWVEITIRKKKVLGGELFTESSSKMNENENLFIPTSKGRILVLESQTVNESLKPTETSNTPESSQDSEAESLTPLPSLKNLQGASPSSEVMPLTFQPHSPRERPGLGIMKHTNPETHDSLNKSVSGTITVSETEPTTPSVPTEVKDTEQESKINELTKLVQMLIDEKDHRTSDHEMYTASLKRSENYKAQPYQYASSSKQILKAKAKPFPPCIHCGFNDHRPGEVVIVETTLSVESMEVMITLPQDIIVSFISEEEY